MNRTLGWLMIYLVNPKPVRTPVWKMFLIAQNDSIKQQNGFFIFQEYESEYCRKNNHLTRIVYFLMKLSLPTKLICNIQNKLTRWFSWGLPNMTKINIIIIAKILIDNEIQCTIHQCIVHVYTINFNFPVK